MKRRMGRVDISPEFIVWKKRRDLWNSVIRWHKGTWINREIIKRIAKAFGIKRPLSITLIEAKRAYKICSDEFERLDLDGEVYNAKFFARRLKDEVASGNIKKKK